MNIKCLKSAILAAGDSSLRDRQSWRIEFFAERVQGVGEASPQASGWESEMQKTVVFDFPLDSLLAFADLQFYFDDGHDDLLEHRLGSSDSETNQFGVCRIGSQCKARGVQLTHG